MITHGNLTFTAWSARQCLTLEPHFVTLLFLPLAHVFARMIVVLCQNAAITLAFAESLPRVPENLREVRPHFIVSVPRLFEKFTEKITGGVQRSGPLTRRLFGWAIGVGRRVSERRLSRRAVPAALALQWRIAERLVLRKVHRAFGGRLLWAASGAAPLDRRVAEFFHALGIPIIEGLGMTENTSLSNVNRLDHNKLGTVGPTVPGVEMKLAPDGEILFRGRNLMKGYYEDPAATAETIDDEGWLHTGDIGTIDEDGFLTITDRKKELIVTAAGKNIAPQRVEKALRASPYLSQIIVHGDRRKYVTALVVLEREALLSWASGQGLGALGFEELCRREEVRRLIETEIAECNRGLASFETVKKFRILPRELSIESGELTPTLKVKRRVVCQHYADLLDEMYREADPAPAASLFSAAPPS
jgi:long-chain acyl-CoA synthetase